MDSIANKILSSERKGGYTIDKPKLQTINLVRHALNNDEKTLSLLQLIYQEYSQLL